MAGALLWLGLLLGLRHAFEADHMAAVASLASRGAHWRDVTRIAAAWGVGHAAVLLAAGIAMIVFGAVWPPSVHRLLEALGGIVLIWLGADVLRRAWRARPASGIATAGKPPGASRALVVGGLHGVEGSGAVVLAAIPAAHGSAQAVGYLASFGVGSVAGMLVCSLALTLPLGLAKRAHTGGRALHFAVGTTSVVVGSFVYMRSIFT